MATTIAQGFSKLRSNLEITSLQSSTVSTRQSNVRDVVKAGLDTNDDFLTGSYRRSTMIAPLTRADVDVFIVLDSKYFADYSNNQAGLLDKVRRVLLKTYTTTPAISRNGQAVTITFTDFTVDVVPGFNREGGGYLIPNSVTSSWISTNPKKHVDIWSTANSNHGGDLVPLIKMIKCWNREHSQLITSFQA
jgi:tRNA nucleotidyltransferase (CCA-adding enzyme)